MKKNLKRITFLFLLIYVIQGCQDCKKCDEKECPFPLGWGELLGDSNQTIYRKNELIVIYKDTPSKATKAILRNRYHEKGIDTSKIVVTTCSDCDSFIELWHGEGIETVINGPLGTGPGSKRAGSDDSLAHYSLNFISKLPDSKFSRDKAFIHSLARKDTIKVAVLDTGIDSLILNSSDSSFIWKSAPELSPAGTNCYPNARYGWNFIDKSNNVNDDNPGLHGTILTEYILNEMAANKRNQVHVMSLKTHNSEGIGNLFDIICALHYAVRNKANIINASWGFYYFDEIPHPYLTELISKILPEKGILFVAAAGNQGDDTDQDAKNYGLPKELYRNLEFHKFYPAHLSSSCNNVISVTTTDAIKVSKFQNYSGNFVDLGVKADTLKNNDMYFNWPFPSNISSGPSLNGSSYAAAIVSGTLAANLPKYIFQPGVNKDIAFQALKNVYDSRNQSIVKYSDSLKYNNLVRYGLYINHGFNYTPQRNRIQTKNTAMH